MTLKVKKKLYLYEALNFDLIILIPFLFQSSFSNYGRRVEPMNVYFNVPLTLNHHNELPIRFVKLKTGRSVLSSSKT